MSRKEFVSDRPSNFGDTETVRAATRTPSDTPHPALLGPLAKPGGTCYSWQGPKPFGEVYI